MNHAQSSRGKAQIDTLCRNERLITDWISFNKDPIKQVVYRKAYVSRLPFNLIQNGLWKGLDWTNGTQAFARYNLRDTGIKKNWTLLFEISFLICFKLHDEMKFCNNFS